MATAEPEIISRWAALIDGLNHSSQEFYGNLEQEIKDWGIPGAKVSTVEHAEGGLLSAKRLYLRVKRGEHTFDVCAAPFGRGFFVSWWLMTLPGCIARIPGIGFLLRRFAKPLTYYSIDTAIMFQSAIHKAVQDVLDSATEAKGVRALTESERKPVMRDFFKQ